MATNNERIKILETKMAALEPKVTDHETRIDANEEAVEDHEHRIGALEGGTIPEPPPTEPPPTEPPPTQPPPTTTSGTLGIAIACDSKGNVHVQKGAQAMLFVSRGGTPKVMRFPWTDRDGGYGMGDGGSYDVYLTKVTSGHVPDRGQLVSGKARWYRGSRSQDTINVNVNVAQPQALVAGTQYALVIENVHGSPDANWGCLNLPYLYGEKVAASLQPRWPHNECRLVIGSSPYVTPFAWSTTQGHSMSHLPALDIEYSDGKHDGFSGIRGSGHSSGDGHSKVTTTANDLYRMRFTAPFACDIDRLWARVSRQTGSGGGDLTYAVRQAPTASSRGSVIASGKVGTSGIQVADHGSGGENDLGDWVGCDIPVTHIVKGTVYAFEIAAPSGTQVWTPGILLRDGASGAPMASWPFDEATYWFEGSSDGGGSWSVTWPAWGDKHVPQMYADAR